MKHAEDESLPSVRGRTKADGASNSAREISSARETTGAQETLSAQERIEPHVGASQVNSPRVIAPRVTGQHERLASHDERAVVEWSSNDWSRQAQSVELQIEELLLQGFAPAERYRLAEAFERELTRLLTEQGVPAALVGENLSANLDGVAFQVRYGSGAEVIGRQVAQALYRSWRG